MKTNVLIPLMAIIGSFMVIMSAICYLRRVMNRISNSISTYIAKGKILESDVLDTRESKLISQVNQLIRITDHELHAAREEKESVKQLISDLSHQLKTPLASISMYTELLKEGRLSEEEKKEFIIRTGEQVDKMNWLLQALLKTSRLETGIIEFEAAPACIKETIAASVSSVYGQAETKHIQIVIEDFKDRKLLHNRKWTAEAITNVIENSIKYSPANSTIKINIIPMEIYTRIDICDEGIGIDKDEYNAIFKRFYRSKKVDQIEGTGLGLYLSRLIIVKQGGYITVNSKQKEGSCFSIYLLNYRE